MSSIPSSPIDQYRYILLLRIISAQAGEWSPDTHHAGSQSVVERDVAVAAHLGEVFKAPHDISRDLRFKVRQRQPADGFRADDYGPWSELDLVAGIELLVFANEPAAGSPIEQTLAEGCGLLVKVPNAGVPFAVEDVRRALAWEGTFGRRLLQSAPARRAIRTVQGSIGPIMAGFLVESLAGEDLADAAQGHEFLIELLRTADVNERFRSVILVHETNTLVMTETPPVWFRAGLIAAMVSILGQQPAEVLRNPIRQTYLFNAVFDANGRELIAVQDVLPTQTERSAFESVLKSGEFAPEQQARLTRWVKGEQGD
jgi:hypothetical protein